jgi:hypothetical protein
MTARLGFSEDAQRPKLHRLLGKFSASLQRLEGVRVFYKSVSPHLVRRL